MRLVDEVCFHLSLALYKTRPGLYFLSFNFILILVFSQLTFLSFLYYSPRPTTSACPLRNFNMNTHDDVAICVSIIIRLRTILRVTE